jgi:hypothetical protein
VHGPEVKGQNRKTWATVNASMVDVIPKRISSAIHPDARGVEVGLVSADMSADYIEAPLLTGWLEE